VFERFCLKCVFLPQNVPNCTDLRIYFQEFSGGDTHGLAFSPVPFPHQASHFLRASVAAVIEWCN